MWREPCQCNDNEETCGPVWDYNFEVQEVIEETDIPVDIFENNHNKIWVGGVAVAFWFFVLRLLSFQNQS